MKLPRGRVGFGTGGKHRVARVAPFFGKVFYRVSSSSITCSTRRRSQVAELRLYVRTLGLACMGLSHVVPVAIQTLFHGIPGAATTGGCPFWDMSTYQACSNTLCSIAACVG